MLLACLTLALARTREQFQPLLERSATLGPIKCETVHASDPDTPKPPRRNIAAVRTKPLQEHATTPPRSYDECMHPLDDKAWFHQTYVDNLPGIQAKGLIGTAESGVSNFKHKGVSQDGVYLRGNEFGAFNWERLWPDEGVAMLRITGLDTDRISLDPEHLEAYMIDSGNQWGDTTYPKQAWELHMEDFLLQRGTSLKKIAAKEPKLPFFAELLGELPSELAKYMFDSAMSDESTGGFIHAGPISPEHIQVYLAQSQSWVAISEIDVVARRDELDYHGAPKKPKLKPVDQHPAAVETPPQWHRGPITEL